MRGWGNPSFASTLSMVRMDHDIDEPARTRLHLGQRVIDLRKRIGVRDQLGQIKHTKLRHLGHRLALARREPVRAAELQTSGHKTDRLDCERLGQSADIDCDCATLERAKRLGVFAAAALRAEQSMSASTPSWSVCRRIQSAIGASPSASTSTRSGASALNCASTSRLRPRPRMRVAPIAKASNVAPTPSVPVIPLIATQLPPRTWPRRSAAYDVPRYPKRAACSKVTCGGKCTSRCGDAVMYSEKPPNG